MDYIYRAIDMYLKEHPGISKSERKRICRLMDCRKLSADACMHAVQNEQLPLRVVVQVLFFEQIRVTTSSSGGNSTPDPPGSVRALLSVGSHGSLRSATTNTEEDWGAVPTAEELKALKGELEALRIRDGGGSYMNDENGPKMNAERIAAANKLEGSRMSRKIRSKLWSGGDKYSENSSSETSDSLAATNSDETKSSKSTPSRSRQHSLC